MFDRENNHVLPRTICEPIEIITSLCPLTTPNGIINYELLWRQITALKAENYRINLLGTLGGVVPFFDFFVVPPFSCVPKILPQGVVLEEGLRATSCVEPTILSHVVDDRFLIEL